MWVLGNMPAYQQRFEVWCFIRTYTDRHLVYNGALRDFEALVECFTNSKYLPVILGLILAFGNYLNGGTNRGQADGFDIETFNKLESVKDAEGKDIRSMIFEVLFNKLPSKANKMIDELMPCFTNITRRLNKDSDGTEKLGKSTRITFEDFDNLVGGFAAEFNEKYETMQMVLQYFEDPADPFRLRMPKEYAQAKELVDGLMETKDRAKAKYAALLGMLKIQAMKSSDFCMLWDNLFIPSDMILNKPDKVKKEVLVPMFCQSKPFAADDLRVLWDLMTPEERAKALRKKKKKAKRRSSMVPPAGTLLQAHSCADEHDGDEPESFDQGGTFCK